MRTLNPSCGDPADPDYDEAYASPAMIKRYRLMSELGPDQAAALVDASGASWKSWELGRRKMKVEILDSFKAKFAAMSASPYYLSPSERKKADKAIQAKNQATKKAGGWAPGQPLPCYKEPPKTAFQLEVEAYELIHGMDTHPSSSQITLAEAVKLRQDFDEGLAGLKRAEAQKQKFLLS